MMARILLIDDEDGLRTAMRRALEKLGYEVSEARDGAEGLALLAAHGADLVITDIFMPGQDGIQVVRRMRKEFPTVKVIAMSGGDSSGRLDLREDMVQLGATCSLAKPFGPADLAKVVREVLGD